MVHRGSNFIFIQPKKAERDEERGKGKRVRKQVNYCDDLLDKLFEDDANDLSVESERRSKKKSKKKEEAYE